MAYGCGGAIGLRAIGWHFEPREAPPSTGNLIADVALTIAGTPGLFCPSHRPDAQGACRDRFRRPDDEPGPNPCSLCTGEEEADKLQEVVARHLHLKLPTPSAPEEDVNRRELASELKSATMMLEVAAVARYRAEQEQEAARRRVAGLIHEAGSTDGAAEDELVEAVLARDEALARMGGLARVQHIREGLDPTYLRLADAIAAVRAARGPEKT